jgi:hypothetical protein
VTHCRGNWAELKPDALTQPAFPEEIRNLASG